jgi:hypothetical protein
MSSDKLNLQFSGTLAQGYSRFKLYALFFTGSIAPALARSRTQAFFGYTGIGGFVGSRSPAWSSVRFFLDFAQIVTGVASSSPIRLYGTAATIIIACQTQKGRRGGCLRPSCFHRSQLSRFFPGNWSPSHRMQLVHGCRSSQQLGHQSAAPPPHLQAVAGWIAGQDQTRDRCDGLYGRAFVEELCLRRCCRAKER